MNPVLTAKNQVTLLKKIRDYVDLSPSERVTFEPMPDAPVAIAAASPTKNIR